MADYTDADAVYPAALSSATTNMPQHATGDTVMADHMNYAQAEIVKIENALGINPNGSDNATQVKGYYDTTTGWSASSIPAFASLDERVNYAERGLKLHDGHPALTTGIHGVGTGAVVGTDLTQTLTNKTINGGTLEGTFSGSPTISGSLTIGGSLTVGGETFNVPAGVVAMSLTAATPAGWLPLDGTAPVITSANYPTLWSALGGVGTYTLPNMADLFPVGVSGTKALYNTGGADSTTLSAANLPQHSHDISHGHSLYIADGGTHAHYGNFQTFGISVNNTHGYDVVRPASENGYSSEGNRAPLSGNPPRVTEVNGNHSHIGTVSNYSGNSGNAGSASPTPVTTIPRFAPFHFIVKT